MRPRGSPTRLFSHVGPCSSLWSSADPVVADRDCQVHAPDWGGEGKADAEADILLAGASSAICVQRFDDSHYLQFTLRIAFRCVLHRYGSQDIRC